MKHRTRVLVIGTSVLAAAGLAVGAALATDDPQPTASQAAVETTAPATTPGDMGSMMAGDMDSMMTGDMDAMHRMMHSMMSGMMPADVLAACDKAHSGMASASTGATTATAAPSSDSIDHASHHRG